MPTDIADPYFEPAWLWATRVTAEAARAALTKGRTPQERFDIYERLILAACEEQQRRKSAKHNNSIVDPTPPTSANSSSSYMYTDERINISEFEGASHIIEADLYE